MTDGAGLAGDAAAGDGADDVHLAHHVGGDQGLTDQELQGVQAKVIIDVPAVDDDGAGSILIDTNPGDGGLPPTGAVGILSLLLSYMLCYTSKSILGPGFGLLGGVLVPAPLEELQTGQSGADQGKLLGSMPFTASSMA